MGSVDGEALASRIAQILPSTLDEMLWLSDLGDRQPASPEGLSVGQILLKQICS
jgi:hypothetical protein